jgi:peptide-methionine (S)-S-oxide reductase
MRLIKEASLLLTSVLFSSIILASTPKTETAIFAGGCFWSMQHDFEKTPGIIETTVGYTGGTLANPTYEQVSSGTTGHYEAIQIVYDPKIISYGQLVNLYWHDTDPTDANGQFCDKGNEYHPVIFYENAAQQKIADESKAQLIQSKVLANVATQVLPAKTFYPAEDYHQHYSDKNPIAYGSYRYGCQRDNTLNAVWGK